MPLSDDDKKFIANFTSKQGLYKRDVLQDLEDLSKDPRIKDIELRHPDKKRGHKREYLVFHTDDVYFHDYSDTYRSKLGEFEIHAPIDNLDEKTGYGRAEHPSIASLNGKYDPDFDVRRAYGGSGDHNLDGSKQIMVNWGGGMIFKGKFKGFKDHTGEGWGYESYHPHVYGGGAMLCLGGYAAALQKGRMTDWISYMEQVFHFLENGGRQGDDGTRHVSMYSACIAEIFSRNKEEIKTGRRVYKVQRSKSELLKGLGIEI